MFRVIENNSKQFVMLQLVMLQTFIVGTLVQMHNKAAVGLTKIETESQLSEDFEPERDRGLCSSSEIIIETFNNRICKQKQTTEDQEDPNMNSSKSARRLQRFPKEIPFFSGNPNVAQGVIYLYTKNEPNQIKEGPSNQLCLLAVPASLCCPDLLGFMAPCHSSIQHIRIVRDSSPNQFIVLLEFRSDEGALKFYQKLNGATYNTLEPDSMCQAVWVSYIERGENSVPPLGHTDLPTCPVCFKRMDESVDGILTGLCNHAYHFNCIIKCRHSNCPVCHYGLTPALVENFVCMECEGTEGLWICMTCAHVGCAYYKAGHAAAHFSATNHTFVMEIRTCRVWDYAGKVYVSLSHFEAGWRDFNKKAQEAKLKLSSLRQKVQTLCKVKQEEASRVEIVELAENFVCMECEDKESLSICLTCGYEGCGHHKSGHAAAHFRATNHIFVMELRACRVWDYAGKVFLHLVHFEASWRDFKKTAHDANLKLNSLKQNVETICKPKQVQASLVKTPKLVDNFVCMKCKDTETIRICLDCGHVGCAHNKAGHALTHFRDTNHSFVMELNTCRVWNYPAQKFVRPSNFEVCWRDFKKTGREANLKLSTLKQKVQTLSRTTELVEDNFMCMECGHSETVWICLVCGHVGCDDIVSGHAAAHFRATNHTFMMGLRAGRVWDYTGKKLVRLLDFEAGWRAFKKQAREANLKLNTLRQKVQTMSKNNQAQGSQVQTQELVGQFMCMECEENIALWICLVCGHVGCGHHKAGHAGTHFRSTNHTFVMDLRTCRVWDYAGKKFVRLLHFESSWRDFRKAAQEANILLHNLKQKVHFLSREMEVVENFVCMECRETEGLWVCMTCAHVGCAQFKAGHAAAHFRATNHTLAMELRTCHVWDYANLKFVRLVHCEPGWRDFKRIAQEGNLKLKTLKQKCQRC